MLIWTLKTFFGKVIGLDAIPKDKREEIAGLGVKAMKEVVKAYAAGLGEGVQGGKVGVKF